MTPYPLRATLRIAVTALLISLTVLTGCFGAAEQPLPLPTLMTFREDPSTPTPPPDDPQSLQSEQASSPQPASSQEVQDLTLRVEQLEALLTQAAAQPPPHEHEPTPIVPIPPPDLCGRDPDVQQAILLELGSDSCHSIATHVLETITELTTTIGPRISPDDFAGMPALRTLHIIGASDFRISPGEFRELPNLQNLAITSQSTGSIEPGAFLGLRGLQSITIGLNGAQPGSSAGPLIPDLQGMPSLQSFYVYTYNWIPEIPDGFFDALPHLETIYIEGEIPNDRDDRTWRLPDDIFANNPNLANVDIQIGGYKSAIRAATDTFLQLQSLNHLNMGHSFEAKEDLRLWLSPESPLLHKIMDNDQAPLGYTLLLPGTE